MDQFHDGHHVRLRCPVLSTYLHAADDGESVTLDERRASMNAAWTVHIYHPDNVEGDVDADGEGDGPYLLLHSAAYGRYLATTATPARTGHHGFRAQLRDYDQPEVEAIMWRAAGSGFADNVVLLRSVGGGYLRANGKRLPWNSGVSVEAAASSMMYWVVETIPVREAGMPDIPVPLPTRSYGYLSFIFRRYPRPAIDDARSRVIQYVYPGEVDGWGLLGFMGRSVFRLRAELALLGNVDLQNQNIAMCVRAGGYGRLTPLVVDLPHGGAGILEIEVFRANTPRYNELQYLDVDAE